MKAFKNTPRLSKIYSPTEHAEQAAFIHWFDLTYPQLVLAAFANGEKRGIHAGVRLKKEGVRAGMPDLLLCVPTPEFGGLFIEMKRRGSSLSTRGVCSSVQSYMQTRIKESGYAVKVCYGCDEAIAAVKEYLGDRGK